MNAIRLSGSTGFAISFITYPNAFPSVSVTHKMSWGRDRWTEEANYVSLRRFLFYRIIILPYWEIQIVLIQMCFIFDSFRHEIRIVHFIGPGKPWRYRYNFQNGQLQPPEGMNSNHDMDFIKVCLCPHLLKQTNDLLSFIAIKQTIESSVDRRHIWYIYL